MRSYVPNTREKGISIDQPSPKFFDFTTFDSIKKNQLCLSLRHSSMGVFKIDLRQPIFHQITICEIIYNKSINPISASD